MIDLSQYKVHDLTHTYSEKVDGFSSVISKTIAKEGWNAKILNIYSHAGTHMDAPFHFGVSDKTIEKYQPTAFMGQAWIVRVDILQKQQLIGVNVLDAMAARVMAGDSLLIQTGWSKEIGKPHYRDGLPRIGKDLALWCVDKKIKILGVEPPSVADVNNLEEVTEIHQVLLGGEVIIVEGLKNLDQIAAESVFLIALPLKIQDGDGAPARVIAFEAKNF